MSDTPPRKVLLVAPNWLGDAVLSLPAARALRELWPDAWLAALCKENLAGWLAAQPTFDEVHSYPPVGRGVRANVAFARSFGRAGFDLIALFPNSLRSGLFAWVSGIGRRVGYARDLRGPLLTHRVRRYQGPKRHHAEYYLEIARQLGWRESRNAGDPWELAAVSAADAEWIESRLASEGASAQESLIGLAPGAAYGPAKRWYPARFAALGRQLLERGFPRLVVFGGPDDEPTIERLLNELRAPVINLAGRTSVGQLAAGLRRCAVLITNDSGTMHLAAAVGAPVVAIFGSTDPQWTGPLGDRRRVLAADVPCRPCFQRTCSIGYQCMKSITVETVMNEVEELLGSGSPDAAHPVHRRA